MSTTRVDLFIRIKNHFKSLIEKGAYLENEALPSVRNASLSLGVNPNTVQKAYQELADDGFIEIIPKKGAFVKKNIKHPEQEILNQLNILIDQLKLYYTKDDILKAIKNHLEGESHD